MTILPDVLAPGLKIVFCGTAAGTASTRARAYYAGPGNRFWDMLFETGLTSKRLEPAQFHDVIGYGIGLTDVVKTASGSDASLPTQAFDPDRLRARILEVKPGILAFNGKRSAQSFLNASKVEYGSQAAQLGSTALFVLPSTSGAARGFWQPQYWHEVAEHVRIGPQR